jgi:DNA-binding response OmpR family regulator
VARLLVVDDDPDLLILLKAHYNVRGFAVEIAQSCEEALRAASENAPDAVLLDYCLPRLDGTHFIEVLRAGAATARTPVVVMTAASAGWVAARLPKDPLVRMIEKPFEFAQLDPLLDELISKSE